MQTASFCVPKTYDQPHGKPCRLVDVDGAGFGTSDLSSVPVISRKTHACIALRETFRKGGKPDCPTSP